MDDEGRIKSEAQSLMVYGRRKRDLLREFQPLVVLYNMLRALWFPIPPRCAWIAVCIVDPSDPPRGRQATVSVRHQITAREGRTSPVAGSSLQYRGVVSCATPAGGVPALVGSDIHGVGDTIALQRGTTTWARVCQEDDGTVRWVGGDRMRLPAHTNLVAVKVQAHRRSRLDESKALPMQMTSDARKGQCHCYSMRFGVTQVGATDSTPKPHTWPHCPTPLHLPCQRVRTDIFHPAF